MIIIGVVSVVVLDSRQRTEDIQCRSEDSKMELLQKVFTDPRFSPDQKAPGLKISGNVVVAAAASAAVVHVSSLLVLCGLLVCLCLLVAFVVVNFVLWLLLRICG